MNIAEMFEEHDDEFLKFDRVENKRSNRRDLHAFIVLDELFPEENTGDIIAAAEHDEIFLDIKEEKFEQLEESQVIELIRCGVRYSSDYNCFCMFV